MMKPTIHLNGTSKDELLRQISEAYDALGTAYDKLSEMAPNGRDYYPQGPDAFHKAQHEHLARVQQVSDIRKELFQLADQIDSEGL